jgi:hypothetical protein
LPNSSGAYLALSEEVFDTPYHQFISKHRPVEREIRIQMNGTLWLVTRLHCAKPRK